MELEQDMDPCLEGVEDYAKSLRRTGSSGVWMWDYTNIRTSGRMMIGVKEDLLWSCKIDSDRTVRRPRAQKPGLGDTTRFAGDYARTHRACY